MKKKIIILQIFIATILSLNIGCKKWAEVEPPANMLVKDNVFSDDATAIANVTGIYVTMSTGTFISLNFTPGLTADELAILPTNTNDALKRSYFNNLDSRVDLLNNYWNDFYSLIFKCNAALEGLSASTGVSLNVKQQLIGETKFIRALLYYYLVGLYGDVPLATTSDYKVNAILPRSSTNNVLDQAISDLKDAQAKLSTNYLSGGLVPYGSAQVEQRVRPTKWAATGLLAKLYLCKKEYALAENEASTVIDNSALFELVPLNSVFLANSREAIWQLQPTNSTVTNTSEGNTFILPASGPGANISRPYFLSTILLNSFEANDPRRTNWVNTRTVGTTNYYYPFKYKLGSNTTSGSEYSMVMRLAEQYLIRAEARALQGKITGLNGVVADLNKLRTRARGNSASTVVPNLPETLSTSQAIDAMIKERQIELFTEFGSRWFDLRRLGKIDEVMRVITPLKGNLNWDTNQQLFPIPSGEINLNPSLRGHQNPGYNE